MAEAMGNKRYWAKAPVNDGLLRLCERFLEELAMLSLVDDDLLRLFLT
jgi:hypothetical protein